MSESDLLSFLPSKTYWQQDPFAFIKPENFEKFGIDPSDIPVGTIAASKHPSQLQSRFGGNAYGLGLFEVSERLSSKDLGMLYNIPAEEAEGPKKNYKELNKIFKQIGLLIRFSKLGKIYYLIPRHLISNTFTHIMAKVDQISKVIISHRKKYLKEQQKIAVISHQDDLILQELSLRFKEHQFLLIDSIEKLRAEKEKVDLAILTTDPFEIMIMERFRTPSRRKPSATVINHYAMYLFWKIYNLLQPDGEIFIISDHHTPKGDKTARVTFNSVEEEKKFALFTHIFRTRIKYKFEQNTLDVNIFDFQKYLGGFYVEQEVVDRLLKGKDLNGLTLEDLNSLSYLNFPLNLLSFLGDQKKNWSRLLYTYFNEILLRPVIPQNIRDEWQQKYSFSEYTPKYMLTFLGRKKPLKVTLHEISHELVESKLTGCPFELLAEYRNSFEYVIDTLKTLDRLEKGNYQNLPRYFMDRIRQPFENKLQRFYAIDDVLSLKNKVRLLERIKALFNPEMIEGSRTSIFEKFEVLPFFGFTHGELREIFLIILGHTPMGRIISGKMAEKALGPVCALAKTYNTQDATNILRYCLLMTMAETEAARGSELSKEEMGELFRLYESAIRVVTNRDLDWDRIHDEETSAIGGIQKKIIRKLLMMINHYEFLENWNELKEKGAMEKETLSDYNKLNLERIENIIRLINTLDRFERNYLHSDPIQFPAFYRKFLTLEFHGTGHLFERMNSKYVFILLWIAINVAPCEVVNFNPVLSETDQSEISDKIRKVEFEAEEISIQHLDRLFLEQFRQQLLQNGSSFIVGTGFQFRLNKEINALEIDCLDMDKIIDRLNTLLETSEGWLSPSIPAEKLENIALLFSDLESFYQSHLLILEQKIFDFQMPKRQKQWFKRAGSLRTKLKSILYQIIFVPEKIFSNLSLLYEKAPSLLEFIIPEFMALKGYDLKCHKYMTDSPAEYILASAKKFQALVKKERINFQDINFLHKIAQKEFGPMATGIVGISESQIEKLEDITSGLRNNKELFDAFVRALVYQDIGRIEGLREKYRNAINPADIAHAGAVIIEKEKIAAKCGLGAEGGKALIFMVRYHSLLLHIIRGEICQCALHEVTDPKDIELCEGFFLISFIMLSAIKEDLIMEDLAKRLFGLMHLCHRVIKKETDFDEYLRRLFLKKGYLYFALHLYTEKGLEKRVSESELLESLEWKKPFEADIIASGRMIFSMERFFKLCGINYIEFSEIADFIMKTPLKYIYKKRSFSSIGYSTFEKELFEAFRIYNTLNELEEEKRHFLLNCLSGDKVRIFGYEKVCGYLNYENQIKLILLALKGVDKVCSQNVPAFVNFLEMCKKIERRYEAINAELSDLAVENLWNSDSSLRRLFKVRRGIILRYDKRHNVVLVDFQDRFNIPQKIAYMEKINDPERLKNYFHHTLRSLRKHTYHTEDYELLLENAFEKKMVKINDRLLDRAKREMESITDVIELHQLVKNFLTESLELGLSGEQKNRLTDLFELRKEALKNEKIIEIDNILLKLDDRQDMIKYWERTKAFLKANRAYFGKEFEMIIAGKFDTAIVRISRL